MLDSFLTWDEQRSPNISQGPWIQAWVNCVLMAAYALSLYSHISKRNSMAQRLCSQTTNLLWWARDKVQNLVELGVN